MTNLLFVTIDDLFSLSAWPLYRDIAVTPNLDRFLAQNTAFDSAFADVAICNPSRAAMLTGQTPWETGVISNAQDLSQHVNLATETLPGILKGAGFTTALGGKVYHTLAQEVADQVSDVRLPSDGLRNAPATMNLPSVQDLEYGSTDASLSDDTLADSVGAFLADYDRDTPFAMFAGIYRPHADWIIPQEFLELYADIEVPLPDFIDTADRAMFLSMVTANFHADVLAADAWEPLVRHYLASVSYADAKLGEMLAHLEASDHGDDTVVVVVSDHGYHLGEGRLWHKYTTYEQAARAPLGIAVPGTEAQIIDAPVNLSSLPATVLELLGLPENPAMQPSLAQAITGTDTLEDAQAVTWVNGSISLRTEDYRYTLYENGEQELFAVDADVMNLVNLADDRPDLVQDLRARAEAEIGPDLRINPDTAQSGGPEDTIYYLGDGLVEISDSGGIDTVYVAQEYSLPEGLENLLAEQYAPGLTLNGNDADNRISGTFRNDLLRGGAGDDRLFGYLGQDNMIGGSGDDMLDGGPAADVLAGHGGNDTLYGAFGDDQLFGNTGNDRLFGGPGLDTLDGGAGDDLLDAAFGNDVLSGAQGNDTLVGGGGWDTLDGGEGVDTAVFEGLARDYRLFSGRFEDFRVTGHGDRDRLLGIERLRFDDREMSTEAFFTYSRTGQLVPLAPTDIALSSVRVTEHSDAGTQVGTVWVSDPDTLAGHSLSVIGGTQGLFAVQDGRLVIAQGARLDYETAPVHNVTLRARDPDGLAIDRSFTIFVDDRPELEIVAVADETLQITNDVEIFVLGAGASTVRGSLAALSGDLIADFGEDDRIVITGMQLDRASITASFSPSRLSVDVDGDGFEDGAFGLSGDLAHGDVMVVYEAGDTVLTFERFLPSLREGVSIAPGMANGIANMPFLTGDGVTGFEVTLDRARSGSAFENALGVYEVTPSGEITDVRLLFTNTSAASAAAVRVTDVEDGHMLGFFLVPDAADLASSLAQTDVFDFVSLSGAQSRIDDPVEALLTINGAVADVLAFHAVSEDLNRDGLQHAVSGTVAGGEALAIGFEDMLGGGDADYQDDIFTVSRFDLL